MRCSFLPLCFSEAGVCNQCKDLGLDKKVENSDLVLVVKVVSVSPKDCVAMYVCGSVDIDLLALHKGLMESLFCTTPYDSYVFLPLFVDEEVLDKFVNDADGKST